MEWSVLRSFHRNIFPRTSPASLHSAFIRHRRMCSVSFLTPTPSARIANGRCHHCSPPCSTVEPSPSRWRLPQRDTVAAFSRGTRCASSTRETRLHCAPAAGDSEATAVDSPARPSGCTTVSRSECRTQRSSGSSNDCGSTGTCDLSPNGNPQAEESLLWPGLPAWRGAGLRRDWEWGEEGPQAPQSGATGGALGGQLEGAEQKYSGSPQQDLPLQGEGSKVTSLPELSADAQRSKEECHALQATQAQPIWQTVGTDPQAGPSAPAGTWPASLAEWGRLVLLTKSPREKAALTHAAFEAFLRGESGEKREGEGEEARRGTDAGVGSEVSGVSGRAAGGVAGRAAGGALRRMPIGVAEAPERPARPEKPLLVHPRQVPKPGSPGTLHLPAHLLHTLAHVELNAVDLAWDTVVRFSALAEENAGPGGQPRRNGGGSYGAMPAHNLLWRDCQKSAGSVEGRMAVIPMVQEARGLDAGPRLAQRLVGSGDLRSAAIVSRIAAEEEAHVAVGVAWFRWACGRTGEEPHAAFRGLIQELCADGVKGPFNDAARQRVGLPKHWYDPSHAADEAGSRVQSRHSEVQRRLAVFVASEERS